MSWSSISKPHGFSTSTGPLATDVIRKASFKWKVPERRSVVGLMKYSRTEEDRGKRLQVAKRKSCHEAGLRKFDRGGETEEKLA